MCQQIQDTPKKTLPKRNQMRFITPARKISLLLFLSLLGSNALAEERILLSRRGKNGGVQLNRRRGELSFYDICESVDDPIVKSECVLFKRPCNKQSPCPFHAEWSETKARLLHFLQTTKLNM